MLHYITFSSFWLGDGVAVVVGGCAQFKLRKSEKKIEKWVPSMCSDRMWESGINNTASLEQPRQRKQDILNAPRWRRDVDWKRFFLFRSPSTAPCSYCALDLLSSYLIFGETFVSRILHDYIDRHFIMAKYTTYILSVSHSLIAVTCESKRHIKCHRLQFCCYRNEI